MESQSVTLARPLTFTPWRWALAALGVLFVGLGALGAVVPGLPTTVFLIAASALFTRSCPWLEQRLIRNRFFAPFVRYLDGRTPMPRRAVGATLVAIALSCGLSALVLWRGGAGPLGPALVVVAGLAGMACVLRLSRSRTRADGGDTVTLVP